MDYLIVASLIVEVLTLSWVERRILGTWFTPFNLLAYPYTVVVTSAFLFAEPLGFVPVYAPSILIWIVGLFIFWATGLALGLIFESRSRSHKTAVRSQATVIDDLGTNIAITVAWALAPLMAFGLYRAQSMIGGWTEIGTLEFKVAYIHGLPAHAVQLGHPIAVYLMGTYKRGRKLQLFTIAMLMLFLLLTQVKGIILSAIIAGIIFSSARRNAKLPIKKIAIGLGVTYVLFNAVYLFAFSMVDSSALTDSGTYGYLARHYMFYLWAGVLSFSHALRTGVGFVGGPWYLIFAPFINLYRTVLGAGPLLIAGSPMELAMDIDRTDIVPGSGSNVYTMLGTLYFYLGPFGAVLLMVTCALLCYGLFLACRSKNGDWMFVLYCTFGTWLMFGFFDYYFASFGFPETVLDCLFMAGLVKWMRKNRGSTLQLSSKSQLAFRSR